jgi:uncharacterized membrane protein YvbJ
MLTSTIVEEQSVIFCQECGQKNKITASFCESCGAALINNQSVATAPSPQTSARKLSGVSFTSVAQGIKKASKRMKMIVASVVAVAVIIAAFFIIGNAVTNPAGIAKGYFQAMADGEYEKAFQYLALENSDFVNKTTFEKYLEENGGKIEGLVNFSVTEKSKEKLSEEEREIMKQWGLSEEDFSGADSDNDFTKTYNVEYAVKGISAQNSQTITLIKNSKKKLLFFADYNVSIDDLLVPDYMVSVLKGSSVSIDGITLTDKNAADESNAYDSDMTNWDIYTVPTLFAGSHELTVKNELCEDYTEKISVNGGGDTTVSTLILKESVRKNLAKNAEDAYRSIFNGAIEGKSFDSLGLVCTSDADDAAGIKRDYDHFVEYIKIGDTGVGHKSVTFKSFTDEEYQQELNTDLTYICSLEVIYDAVKVENTSWFEVSLEETSLTDRSQNIRFIFIYEDGTWVTQSIPTGSSYYY